jgi:hypothetical protein
VAGVAQVVQASFLAVALARGVDQAQAPRRARLDEALLQRDREVLWKTDADEAAGGEHVAVVHQAHGIRCRHDLATLRQRRHPRVGVRMALAGWRGSDRRWGFHPGSVGAPPAARHRASPCLVPS